MAARMGGTPRDARPEPGDGTAETRQRLWLIAVPPTLWLAHFLASYLTAALWCAKVADGTGSLGPARWAIAGYTAAALVGIALVGWAGLRRWRLASSPDPARRQTDRDLPGDRHRFLGFATLLLAALAAVAVVYGAMPAALIGSCR